jgi:hypothetical protein
MAKNKPAAPHRMPGDTPSPSPGGMRNYIVLLKEDDAPAGHGTHASSKAGRMQEPPEKRSRVLEAGTVRTAEFQRKLRELLKEHGVADEVSRITKPSVFPIVGLTSTPKVASLIQTLPEVEAVVPDRDDIKLLP